MVSLDLGRRHRSLRLNTWSSCPATACRWGRRVKLHSWWRGVVRETNCGAGFFFNVSGVNQSLYVIVQTFNLGNMMLIQGTQEEVGGGICKSVIRSRWLNAKLLNPHAPLDQRHMTQIRSLHGCTEKVGLHQIRCLFLIGYNLDAHNPRTPHSYYTCARPYTRKKIGRLSSLSARETRSTTERTHVRVPYKF
jgi:hypothetical protein